MNAIYVLSACITSGCIGVLLSGEQYGAGAGLGVLLLVNFGVQHINLKLDKLKAEFNTVQRLRKELLGDTN